MDKKFGFGFYQSGGNMRSVGRMSVFDLWPCRWKVGGA